MARSAAKDPLDKFRFLVEIEGFANLGFTSCETPSYSINTTKYAEGGEHLHPKQIIESIEFKPVILQRGVTTSNDFEKWARQPFELHNTITDDNKNAISYRKTVIIHHINRQGTIVKTYKLYNCFPIEYKPASDFQADADDGLSLERISLAYESFEVINTPNNTNFNPLDPTDLVKRIINRF